MTILSGYAKSYQSVTEYLTEKDKNFLTSRMEKTPPLPGEWVNMLIAGKWSTLIPQCERSLFPMQSLKLLKEQNLTAMQWSTSQLFFNVYPHHKPDDIRFIPVFSNGKINTQARSMIKATMKVAFTALILYRQSQNLTVPKQSNASHWTEAQEMQFYARLWHHYPSSEHHFMVVPENEKDHPKTVMDQIAFKIGFNALSRFRLEGKLVRMIPSRGMMQAYIDDSSLPPQPLYRIGISPVDGLHQALHSNYRELFQSFEPLVDYTPPEVDGHPADPAYAEAEIHDFYHQYLIASAPLSHRLLFADLGDAIKAFTSSDSSLAEAKEFFRAHLIDMEHDFYGRHQNSDGFEEMIYGLNRNLKRFTPEMLFWMTVGLRYVDMLEKLGKPWDSPLPEFITFIAGWLVDHHHHFDTLGKSIVHLLISNDTMPLVDRSLNFYYDLRLQVQAKIQKLLIEKIAPYPEDLREFYQDLDRQPDTFVKAHMIALVKSVPPDLS